LNPERWQQISRIFKSAISLEGEERAAYVKSQCGVDDSLREEVEKLIDSHRRANKDGFIDGKAAEAWAGLVVEESDKPAQSLLKGQRIGAYEILDNLGAGGMGEVYLARDSRLGRTVALKVLSPDVASDKRRMKRFQQEAKVASSLNQPNILTIFESGEADGLTFLATEFIDGQTLREYLHKKQLKLTEILDIAIQILAALEAAHEAHIVHRDIKPENVMIRHRDRVVKVLDFGLAKVAGPTVVTDHKSDLEAATEFKTAPGTVMGTVNYMSPEQAQAHAVDGRTDIWSTGVLNYEMVTGAIPFKGATASHTIVQILETEPASLLQATQGKVPAELHRIVLKALAKDPDERYQTAKDMVIDLRHLRKQLDTTAPVESLEKEVERKPGKTRVLVIVLAAMLLFTAAVFAFNLWRSSRARSASASLSAPAAAPTVVPERTLTYWITVQKFRNKKPYQNPFTLNGEINFEADYQIRLNVRALQAGYFYVLNEGPTRAAATPEFVVLFPSFTSNDGSPRLSAEQTLQIPEQSLIQFDPEQGIETLWLVFSEEPVPELDAAAKRFVNEQSKGLITDTAVNSGVQQFLSGQSAARARAEKSSTLTTLKIPGMLLLYPVTLELH
jgi:serine/threonine protein kinase